MGNPIQFQEYDDEVVEITFRCQQARLLFRPGDEFNRRFIGCLGQAIKISKRKVRVHFGGGESNHVHLIVSAETVVDRSAFKCHLRTNLSKEIGDLHDWKEGIFSRRCRDVGIRDGSMEDRLMYCAAHGVKSGLVSKPIEWPGVQFVRAVTEGVPLKGIWYNRTKFYRAVQNWKRLKHPGRRPRLMDFAEERLVELAPLPGFDAGLPAEERQAKWHGLLNNALKAYPPSKRAVLGADKLKGANPHTKPRKAKRSPAPKLLRAVAKQSEREEPKLKWPKNGMGPNSWVPFTFLAAEACTAEIFNTIRRLRPNPGTHCGCGAQAEQSSGRKHQDSGHLEKQSRRGAPPLFDSFCKRPEASRQGRSRRGGLNREARGRGRVEPLPLLLASVCLATPRKADSGAHARGEPSFLRMAVGGRAIAEALRLQGHEGLEGSATHRCWETHCTGGPVPTFRHWGAIRDVSGEVDHEG